MMKRMRADDVGSSRSTIKGNGSVMWRKAIVPRSLRSAMWSLVDVSAGVEPMNSNASVLKWFSTRRAQRIMSTNSPKECLNGRGVRFLSGAVVLAMCSDQTRTKNWLD
ncbi:hypothetical protein PMIN03_002443 [Paraphaeosphaeria minitans]